MKGFKTGLRYTKDRVSVVFAYQHSKLIAPMVYKGTMDSVYFNTTITKVLLPLLPQGSIVILDNASVHKSSDLLAIFEEYECHLLYLPQYSPELNPIERCWSWVKQKLYQLMQESNKSFRTLLNKAIAHFSDFSKSVLTAP